LNYKPVLKNKKHVGTNGQASYRQIPLNACGIICNVAASGPGNLADGLMYRILDSSHL
jgi:hypothetical protein